MGGAPGSPVVNAVAPRMANADYAVNFSLALMDKDLAYAINEADRAGLSLRTAIAAGDLFVDAIEAGLGDVDFSAIIEPLRTRWRGLC